MSEPKKLLVYTIRLSVDAMQTVPLDEIEGALSAFGKAKVEDVKLVRTFKPVQQPETK